MRLLDDAEQFDALARAAAAADLDVEVVDCCSGRDVDGDLEGLGSLPLYFLDVDASGVFGPGDGEGGKELGDENPPGEIER